MGHEDRFRTGATDKAYKEGYSAIDWSAGKRRRKAAVKKNVAAPMILSDIEGFMEPGGTVENGGQYIEGRRALREYEQKNGVRQIGND